MALPSSRNRTYASGVQVRSADINAIQDCIIQGAHGPKPLLLPASMAMLTADATVLDSELVQITSVAAGWPSVAGDQYQVDLPIPLHAGDRILEITFYLKEAGGAGESVIFSALTQYNPASGTNDFIGISKTSGVTNGNTTVVYGSPDVEYPHTLVDGRLYGVTITMPSTTTDGEAVFRGARVLYDRPLV